MYSGEVMMRNYFSWAILVVFFPVSLVCTTAQADVLQGLPNVTVVDGAIISLTYDGTVYTVASGDLLLGTTTRWYIPTGGAETLWVDGTAAPADTVTGTSNAKIGDIGAKADNFIFAVGSVADTSSIDGINFQQTIFSSLSKVFFVFERGGNDSGIVQAILPDLTLGPALTLTKNAAPYANTNVSAAGQNAFGYVLVTDVPVMGLRITASGHDALSVSAIPEPMTMSLLALGGLLLRRNRQ
jgi:hypothetical protein